MKLNLNDILEEEMYPTPHLLAQLRLEKNNDRAAAPFVHLQQLYEFEFSPITKYEINEAGLYQQESLCEHWSKHGVDIYVAFKNKTPIGFAVVNLSSMISDDTDTRDIAEFFIMPSERANQIGKWMAYEIFMKYLGKWEVRQFPGLYKAHRFWLRTIDKFTGGYFIDKIHNDSAWRGSVQYFESTLKTKERINKWPLRR